MRAMVIDRLVSVADDDAPLRLVDLAVPEPCPGEVRLRVAACGVCHTELDEIEGRTPPSALPRVPGHEVVGYVDKLGDGASAFQVGERVGVGWIYASSGEPDENVSPQFRATGRDVDGGYAEYMTVPEAYAYPVPHAFSDAEAAPLLCAGGVGYRALKLTRMTNGDRLGLTGFGGSAHLVLQMARHLYPDSAVYVFARDAESREFALQLGADWAGDTGDEPPHLLHAIIDTTPAWRPVLAALAVLRPAGRLVINAIRKEDTDKACLLDLSYPDHLWREKQIKTVANVTRQDLAEFLPLAARIPLRPEVETYPLEAANEALTALKRHPVKGAKVLTI